jgi:hypothetical protein
MSKDQSQNKKPSVRIGMILTIAAVLLIIGIGGVFAKYIHDAGGGMLLSAREFYFTSNLLQEETKKYILNSTATEVSFTLGNYADNLRVSEMDIAYTVTVKTKSGGQLPQILDSNAGGLLLADQVSETTVTLKNLQKGETYIVTATGKNSYKQTLTAEFTVSDSDENVYWHLDTSNDAFVALTVWTHNVTGHLTVTTPAGLIPDNTDPILQTAYNYSSTGYGAMQFIDNANFTGAYSSYTYRFFISDDGFIADDFAAFITQDETEYPAVKANIPK